LTSPRPGSCSRHPREQKCRRQRAESHSPRTIPARPTLPQCRPLPPLYSTKNSISIVSICISIYSSSSSITAALRLLRDLGPACVRTPGGGGRGGVDDAAERLPLARAPIEHHQASSIASRRSSVLRSVGRRSVIARPIRVFRRMHACEAPRHEHQRALAPGDACLGSGAGECLHKHLGRRHRSLNHALPWKGTEGELRLLRPSFLTTTAAHCGVGR